MKPFSSTLLARASLAVRRDALTAADNARLDAQVSSLLLLLSPHFLEPACFQVLEYLVRRYAAHERCVPAMMACALPYHAAPEFARLVSVLALGNAGSLGGGGQRSPFLFLQRMQETGAPAPRELLAQRCARDPALLRWVCEAAGEHGESRSARRAREGREAEADEQQAEAEAVAKGGDVEAAVAASAAARRRRALAAAAAEEQEEEEEASSRLPTGNRAFLSFYAALMCDVIALSPRAADPGPQGLAAVLLPSLAQGLSAETASADFRAATLMVVTALAARCALGSEFLAGERWGVRFCRFIFSSQQAARSCVLRAPWMNAFFSCRDGVFRGGSPSLPV